ncbi:MAG: RDD family protein [Dehalococcoidia bacterium]|nr:RDD family protein [Dehalococcoidia bacterium]
MSQPDVPLPAPTAALPAMRTFVPARARRGLTVASQRDCLASVTIDLLAGVAACPFVLPPLALVLRGWWPAGALIAAHLFLAVFWAMGRTPGMYLVGTRLADAATGRDPGFGAGLSRAALLLPAAVALFLLADASLPHPTAPFSRQPVVLWSSLAVLGAAVFSHTWALYDREGRALHDRLCGLVVVRDAGRPGTNG